MISKYFISTISCKHVTKTKTSRSNCNFQSTFFPNKKLIELAHTDYRSLLGNKRRKASTKVLPEKLHQLKRLTLTNTTYFAWGLTIRRIETSSFRTAPTDEMILFFSFMFRKRQSPKILKIFNILFIFLLHIDLKIQVNIHPNTTHVKKHMDLAVPEGRTVSTKYHLNPKDELLSRYLSSEKSRFENQNINFKILKF